MNPDKQLILDFTGTYEAEGFHTPQTVSLRDVEGTCCYCDPVSSYIIRSRIAPYGYDGIHWIDGGDYHYASLFFLEMIPRRFSLLLYDNHSDDGEGAFGGTILSCGNWVRYAQKLPKWREDSPDIPVYISIDKDILSTDYARTNWDQGKMTLDELCERIKDVASRRKILGVDICGEIAPHQGATYEDLQINRRTNEVLRELFLNLKD